MPAKNAHQQQAQDQQWHGLGVFGKCIWLTSTTADSVSEYEYESDSTTHRADLSDDCPDETSAIKALESFYEVFREPTNQGNVKQRINNVRKICLRLIPHVHADWFMYRPSLTDEHHIPEIQSILNIRRDKWRGNLRKRKHTEVEVYKDQNQLCPEEIQILLMHKFEEQCRH